MSTLDERLTSYYDFSPHVITAVARMAALHNSSSYRELADMYGVADGPQMITPNGSGSPLEILEFTPKIDYDPTFARVYHLSMGNHIMPNLAYYAMCQFGADQSTPLKIIGNPSGPGHNGGTVSKRDALMMMRRHTLAPAVTASLRYLEERNIQDSIQIGYSYGADKAAATAALAPEFGVSVQHLITEEPASMRKQPLIALGARFGLTGRVLARYTEQAGSPTQQEALQIAAEHSTMLEYVRGLGRLSNVAIATVLAHGGFEERVRQAQEAHDDMKTTVAWGSSSELVPDGLAQQISDRLGAKAIRLKGMHHAGADDPELSTAIMLEGYAGPV
jgi:pimeloyl-ACP methyl ester carboxylesterase